MVFSKRSLEGYLMVDHRHTDGIEASDKGGIPVGANQLFEAPIATCSHCQRGVVMNPGRTRERAYCPKCDHYLCDECELVRVTTGECKTFNQIIDEVQEAAVNAKARLII